MPRPAILFAAVLCCAVACESGKPPTPQKAEPQKTEPAPATVREAEAPAPASAEPPPTPAWFDATKIQHSVVINQMSSQGAIAGGQAWALILELEAGVSNQQCIDRARAVIAESVPDVPEATTGEDGRLTIQGKTDDYHYTVVCGEAKGKPTMYLSYTSK